jgi:hypothetical protein
MMTTEVTQTKVFGGHEFEFIGDAQIVCKCLSNGRRCNQRDMEQIDENPWIDAGEDGKVCKRVWRELPTNNKVGV